MRPRDPTQMWIRQMRQGHRSEQSVELLVLAREAAAEEEGGRGRVGRRPEDSLA